MTPPYAGRTLLVGLGGIGVGYDLAASADDDAGARAGDTIRTHAAAIQACAATVLVGGVDPCGERRAEFEAAFHAPAWASLNDTPAIDIDIVVVATPTSTHREVTTQALSRFSPRLLVCEKPVGTSAADTRSIVAMAEHHGTTMVVNYFRRYLPALRDLKEAIRRGEFGVFSGGSVLYSHGLRRNGSHFVALLLWLVGDAQVRQRAVADDPSEDPGFALCFDDATVGFSSLGHGAVRAAEICLGFSRGLLRITSGGRMVSWAGVHDDPGADAPAYSEVWWERGDDMLRCQLPVYEWLTSPDLKPSDVSEDVSVAVRTQEIVDEVTRGTGQ
jgi:predicted dehydrogenase